MTWFERFAACFLRFCPAIISLIQIPAENSFHPFGFFLKFGLGVYVKALPLNNSQLASLDLVVNRFFMKLFKTTEMQVVKMCREHFDFVLPSLQFHRRRRSFVDSPVTTVLIKFVFPWCFICCILLPWFGELKFLVTQPLCMATTLREKRDGQTDNMRWQYVASVRCKWVTWHSVHYTALGSLAYTVPH